MNLTEHQLGQRILIIGCAGSGKTTLAKKLSKKLQLPIIHLDKYFWGENWGRPTDEEWEKKVWMLCENPTWIMDGNYTDTLPLRLKYASSVIFLDVPRWKCLSRALIRRFRFYHNKKRTDIPEHCKEKLNFSFYSWIWHYPKRSREKTLALLEAYNGAKFYLKNKHDMKQFIQDLV
jgi:adenylate kinase family enzyme